MCGAKYHGCLTAATNFYRALTLSRDARAGSEGGPLKLTEGKVPFTLGRLKGGCESFPCFCYFLQSPIGWEVVQLVGLQTLELFRTFANTGFCLF